MDSLRFVELATVAMAGLVVLMAITTVGVKVVRYLKVSWYKRHYRRIEPALENYILTGEDQPELSRLRPWQRDLFLSRLIIERMSLLRGAGREYLMQLAKELGLVDRYLRTLRSRRRWRRARAAESLGYFGGEQAVEPLVELLSDEDETIRAVAARALARIGSDRAVQLLAQTLDNPSDLTRLRVAENLERLGNRSVKPLSGELLSLETHGALTAAEVLGNLRDSAARPALSSALLYTRDEDVKAQATLALGKIGDPADIPLILQSAKSPSWPVRAQAANALGLIGEVSTIPVLEEMATDQEWWVRLNATKALANMGPEGEKTLLELLLGDDLYARDRAAATLESRGVTRRMVRQLVAPGRKGKRARTVIDTLIRSGVTKHLRGLLDTLPDGEERRILSQMLNEEGESESPASVEAAGAALEIGQEDAGSARVEAASAEPPGAEQIDVDPARVDGSMQAGPASPSQETTGENLGRESSGRRSNDDGRAAEDIPQSSRKEKPDKP